MGQDFIFHQLFEKETSTYTYILADKKTSEAAIIDSVLETVDRDFSLLEELGLKLKYVLETHIHADHITGAAELRKRTGAQTAVSENAKVSCADLHLQDGQILFLGEQRIAVLETPGHTDTCLTYFFADMLFTGDALLIRSCGRTDFQQGSSEKLFASVRNKLFHFSDQTKVYPGHDYRGMTTSTIGAEKRHNPRLNESLTLDDFIRIMNATKRELPKRIHEAVPANMICGQTALLQSQPIGESSQSSGRVRS